MLGAGWTLSALYRRRLVGPRTLAGLVMAWAVLVLGLFALLSWAVRERLVAFLPVESELLTWPYLAAAAVLFAPLNRLALAPLALAWNRHR
jgi:hypothetical protein